MSISRLDGVVWGVAGLLAGLIGLVILWGPAAAPEIAPPAPAGAGNAEIVSNEPAVLYLHTPENGLSQVFRSGIDGDSTPEQLTQSPANVLDFAVSPAGSQIAYSTVAIDPAAGAETAVGPMGLSDIWVIDAGPVSGAAGANPRRALACTDASCVQPVWMPDGRRLIYERRTITPEGLPGNPRLWWLDVETGETIPVFGDSQILGLLAAVSPDGRWLSFISPTEQAIRIVNLETAAEKVIPNRMGAAVNWRPDSQMIAFADIVIARSEWSMELMTLDLAADDTRLLTDILETENNYPVWSPDGQWLAFGRKKANAAMGRQIWLMNIDGSPERQLTDNNDLHHGQVSWSPDGRYLAYQQYNLQELYAKPSVWVIDTQTGETTEIAASASQPAWLP